MKTCKSTLFNDAKMTKILIPAHLQFLDRVKRIYEQKAVLLQASLVQKKVWMNKRLDYFHCGMRAERLIKVFEGNDLKWIVL
jgi:hypothetical protein